MTSAPPHVGAAIAQTLARLGVPRVFVVPGESFLPVLDGLHDSPVDTIVCRHEGGAAYMAEAYGKMTSSPGVAMVTRGPGAANAFVGIHTARQDATAMVLFVGLIPFTDRDRESFQEFDPRAWFGSQAKHVFVIDTPQRASEIVAEAFHLASSGRPGPVVVGLPEDLLYQPFTGSISGPRPRPDYGLSSRSQNVLETALHQHSTTALLVGGAGWSPRLCQRLDRVAGRLRLPVFHDWRAGDRVPFSSDVNAGYLGYGRSDTTARLFASAELVIAIGAHLTDVPSDGFQLRQQGETIVISPDAALTGHSGKVTAQLVADPKEAVAALERAAEIGPPPTAVQKDFCAQARAAHAAASTIRPPEQWPPIAPGTAHLDRVFQELQRRAGADAMYSFGAGNHCIWAQWFARTESFPSQLSTRNGSMGYSVPAAVSAKLQYPQRLSVAIAGDGELLMNGQELATALHYSAPILVIVSANGEFGTIRDHQENHFPGRVCGTQLHNPDFALFAQACGGYGEIIEDDSQVEAAFTRAFAALEQGRSALLQVAVDQGHSSPEGIA